MKYLRIRNWDRYQHYKADSNRRVVWVKLYTAMLRDVELRRLDLSTRFLYTQLLLLAAEYNNSIPNDAKEIGYAINMPPKQVQQGIDKLLQGKWICGFDRKHSASTMLEQKRREEKRKEKEENRPESSVENRFCPRCGVGFLTLERLGEHLADVHHHDMDAA